MWARPLGAELFEIQNIPFYAYDLNLEDVVVAVSPDPTLKPEIKRVLRRSGHRTLRIVFTKKQPVERQNAVLDSLAGPGVTFERANKTYIAIDVAPDGDYEKVCDQLQRLQKKRVIGYETCEARVLGRFDDRTKRR